jgi:hypothetical protein
LGFLLSYIKDNNLQEGTKYKLDVLLTDLFNILGENANIRGTPLLLDENKKFRYIDTMTVFELSVIKVDGVYPKDVNRYDFREETRLKRKTEEELVYYSSDEN